MARPLRIEFEGGVYHVTTRARERRDVVRDDEDRAHWLRLFDRVASRFGWRVFAWALMRNHWHIFLSTPEPNLSRGMHDLNSGYATVFNRRHRRRGTLFQGRFKAILVQDEGYGWTLSRYVHLNPVRAGAVARPDQYRWSSYRDYLSPNGAPCWLDWEAVLGAIGKNMSRSRREYIRFVESGVGRDKIESPLAAVVGGVLLGSESWVDRMKSRIQAGPPRARANIPARHFLASRPTSVQVEKAVCAACEAKPAQLFVARRWHNDARMAAVYLARECAATPVTELARRFGSVSPSAISRLVRRAQLRRQHDRKWDRLLDHLERNLKTTAQKSKVKT
jgi:REP element-mobilizing transposase RayT